MTDVTNRNVYAIILAAGTATRFGATKQLAETGGVSLVEHAVDIATRACGSRTALVLGHDWRRVSDACKPIDGFLVLNDAYEAGIGASIAAGVRSVRHVADAIIVLHADQPLITTKHLRALEAAWSGADNEVVATAFAGTLGPPVLFPSGCFDELIRLRGDSGAKRLLQGDRYPVKPVAFEDAAIDIDTREDLERL